MYGWLTVSVLAASVNSVLLNKREKTSDPLVFNGGCAAVWLVILLAMCGGRVTLNAHTLLYGVLYGVVQVLFLVFKTQAMASGPVSLTTLIGNTSLLLSTAVSVIVWQESVSLLRLGALVGLLVSVILCGGGKSPTKTTARWRGYTVAFFLFAAGVGLVFKFFAHTGDGHLAGDMMVVASFTMVVLLASISGITRRPLRGTFQTGRGVGLMLLCGVLSCVYNRLNITLSGALPGLVFFPVFNGGVIVVSTALSLWLLHEKLNRRQTVGLILGTMAVVAAGI